jgi:hypothetical protein
MVAPTAAGVTNLPPAVALDALPEPAAGSGDLRPRVERRAIPLSEARDNSCMQANPRLEALAVLVGEWTTVGAHPMLPGRTFHGHTTFSWQESGAFLLVHMHIDEPEIPDGVAILGTDDATPDGGAMLYFDVRNVSREYRWTISGNVWTWSRDAPGFSQRMVLTIAGDGHSIEAKGEMSQNGQTWEPDLQLTYSRLS